MAVSICICCFQHCILVHISYRLRLDISIILYILFYNKLPLHKFELSYDGNVIINNTVVGYHKLKKRIDFFQIP